MMLLARRGAARGARVPLSPRAGLLLRAPRHSSRRMALRHFTLSLSLCAETIGATWEVRSENNMERVRAMIAPPSYLYEVSSARAPEGFHSVKEEPQRKDFQVDFPFENPTGYKKPTARTNFLLSTFRF